MQPPLGPATDLIARQGLRHLQADTALYHAMRPPRKMAVHFVAGPCENLPLLTSGMSQFSDRRLFMSKVFK
jgi:hypothetical protein